MAMDEKLSIVHGRDMDLLRTLFKEYAALLEFDLDFQEFDKELKTLPGAYAPPHGCILMAMQQEEVAGCVCMRNLGNSICEMKRLYVRKQYRGLGIGRALAQAVIREAQSKGYGRMRLDTVPAMKKAKALYDSLGFKEIEP